MKKLVVIGNGMVGQRFLEELLENNEPPFEITVFCQEPRAAYDRVKLSSYFSGSTANDLSIVEDKFFTTNNIKLLIEEQAQRIDREQQLVYGSKGSNIKYDLLVLATGSFPFVPPIAGNEREACHVYRTIEDLDAIQASAQSSNTGVVVGGGLLGLEAAKALKDLGLETHIVEFAPQLMAVQLDEQGGTLLQEKIEALGLFVHTDTVTREITDGKNARHKMVFENGELETDVIVFSAGIRPQDALARECGLQVGERGGVIIDEQCRTSDENIFAIGEVALWNNRIFGLVAPGYEMASVLAKTLLDHLERGFNGADMSTKLKLLGVEVGSIGDAHARTPGAQICYIYDNEKHAYKKLVISEDKRKLLGAVLVGDTSEYDTLLQYSVNAIDLPESSISLILPDAGEKPSLGVDALPGQAQICSCNNVSKQAICEAVSSGCHSIGDLKSETRASSTCGGCTSLVKQVLDAKLIELGVEVNNFLCEHFSYSRQELYHIVRVNNIKSFDELNKQVGKGLGCDICKPTVASILASCWNDYILKKPHAALQDTNDAFLANLQKDGTYSVIPRVAAGEITPDKLIILGEVAKKYDLYTKITGGQRIDLLGAHVDQLPLIWKELVDAGFESGHAYGKALRTVKSCVGSSWCRYGVQDSVSMAIFVEERYRGLRSPHKLKMAVSGCTRECAEAQSKDVGVIATENGWNLYLCGNGGMRPRHAELFASDINDETLIRYIDRFLMFYIKTADRLQRTSVWRENLEGGLAYIQDVIINDSLGIGSELEAQMQRVVDSYQCEWKSTIEDEQAIKRFRTFINSDEQDEHIVYVRERGQKRPAKEEEKSESLLEKVL